MHVALLTLTVVLVILQAHWSLRILNHQRSVNPEGRKQVEKRLTELETGLSNGTIKVEPVQQTKLVRAAVKNFESQVRDGPNELAPYLEMTQILLVQAILIFLVQLSIAIGLPLWKSRRTSRTSGTH